ncbi:hypothetical protein HYQ44_010876 [Verticillium longisporum]|nr:hypothetical protein HYQ44_010876 [Verticillium longisporum]
MSKTSTQLYGTESKLIRKHLKHVTNCYTRIEAIQPRLLYSPSALQHRDFNDKLLDSQSIRKMDPNPKPDPQDHGKPAGEGGGNSKSSDDAPIIDEDATFRNAAYFGNEEGSKDKDGGSQKK